MTYNMILHPQHFSLASQLPHGLLQVWYMKSRCLMGIVGSRAWTSQNTYDMAVSSQHSSLLLDLAQSLYKPLIFVFAFFVCFQYLKKRSTFWYCKWTVSKKTSP